MAMKRQAEHARIISIKEGDYLLEFLVNKPYRLNPG